jgi:mRNA export factor
VFKEVQSPLKYQTRCIAAFPDKSTMGYLVGSIEGRVAVQHVDDNLQNKNFTFKCHREEGGTDIYAVNHLCFHPTQGTFVTTGSDGKSNCYMTRLVERSPPNNNSFIIGRSPSRRLNFNELLTAR